jgi:AcrR family transcriptional regulator
VAIELLLRKGYDEVSVDEIAAAAGIGRTTFFRYFPTKAHVVWAAFDDAISRLAESLAQDDGDGSPLQAVARAVVTSTRGAVDVRGVWLDRFELLDTAPALRGGAAAHWDTWQGAVAAYVARRTGSSPGDVVPSAIAGAVQGVYVAELRAWLVLDTDAEHLLERLGRSLERVGGALEVLLEGPARA